MSNTSKIYRVTEYDLLATKIENGNYYMCTDTKKMYKDINGVRRFIDVISIATELDRVYNTRPNNGKYYYVWETNELWSYNSGWIILVGESRKSNGYFYNTDNSINGTDEVSVLDNNGLLKDGSVVIRDLNRVIKGKLYIDQLSNNLVLSSFLGGGFTFLPSGSMNDSGSLSILSSKTFTGEYDEETGEPIYTSNSGEMTFNGDIYTNTEGVKRKVVTEDIISNNESFVKDIIIEESVNTINIITAEDNIDLVNKFIISIYIPTSSNLSGGFRISIGNTVIGLQPSIYDSNGRFAKFILEYNNYLSKWELYFMSNDSTNQFQYSNISKPNLISNITMISNNPNLLFPVGTRILLTGRRAV